MTSNKIELGKSQALYQKAKTLIPGGTQLLSKRPEMFLPDLWPAYYDKAKGCKVTDLDGKEYIDVGLMGVGSNLLGFCDEDVDNAVIDAIRRGTNTTLNAPEEIELAEMLLDIHPWADLVRYARTGGEAMAIAVRIARAGTGKDKVMFCGYHGWHDWYLSSNLAEDKLGDGHLIPGLEPNGVPRALLNTSIPFAYNDTADFLAKIDKYGDDMAAVVIESVRNFEPDPAFFEAVRNETTKRGIVLIVDEITAGFRMNVGGAHLRYDLVPDIAIFGKAFSNGYPMAAIIGKKEFMDAAQKSFISSLFWTERMGLAAAIATIKKMQKVDSPSRVIAVGEQVQKGWKEIIDRTGLKMKVMGFPAISALAIQEDQPLVYKTYYIQEMLKRGYLSTVAFYASCAHEGYVEDYLRHTGEIFEEIAGFIRSGAAPESFLEGPVCHAGFARLT
ncbi:MAG: aminotransferase class III-fold pyridoxal phosphate-dependent enzyme [Flavobacteriales bacterium]|nr:aminotransferase class III-fold pyridoxal phosphate-dependent enzyme [Flavobacteriales bacterium]